MTPATTHPDDTKTARTDGLAQRIDAGAGLVSAFKGMTPTHGLILVLFTLSGFLGTTLTVVLWRSSTPAAVTVELKQQPVEQIGDVIRVFNEQRALDRAQAEAGTRAVQQNTAATEKLAQAIERARLRAAD